MTIKSCLELADKPIVKVISDELWALRVLAGAYRREKQISNKLKKKLNVLDPNEAYYRAQAIFSNAEM